MLISGSVGKTAVTKAIDVKKCGSRYVKPLLCKKNKAALIASHVFLASHVLSANNEKLRLKEQECLDKAAQCMCQCVGYILCLRLIELTHTVVQAKSLNPVSSPQGAVRAQREKENISGAVSGAVRTQRSFQQQHRNADVSLTI